MSCLDPEVLKAIATPIVIGLMVIFGGVAACIAAWRA